ncbi:S8 family peptidase [Kribbella catacumbae]|uniref:S8 family peptidase n=1 Tax=Kribbella catacumbae TaxID=460086 RepID=UPI0003A52CDA|nr:S8 family peptidase [Kribbella catacumbae]
MADHLRLPEPQRLTDRRIVSRPVVEPPIPRRSHGATLADELQAIEDVIGQDLEIDGPPIVLKFVGSTRLPDGPLGRLKLEKLGEGRGWTYFVMSPVEARRALAELVTEYRALPDGADFSWSHPKTWASFIDHITGVELYGPEDRADASLSVLDFSREQVVDCLIWPSRTEVTVHARIDEIRNAVGSEAASERSRFVGVDERPDRTVVRLMVTRQILDRLLALSVVERVRAPLSASVRQEMLFSTVAPKKPARTGAIAIGIVDGVIDRSNGLTGPYLVGSAEFPATHVFGTGDMHGTAVAANAIWGDLDPLVLGGEMAVPYPVASARVMDGDSVAGIAHRTIEDAIRWLVNACDVRIINLSLNRMSPASNEPLRDELTFTLDSLARELKILIVVSAGNREFDLRDKRVITGYPAYLDADESGVSAPGDAAIVVTVGSYAKRDVPEFANRGDLAIAKAGQPSPFTRLGPTRGIGRSGTLKPEFAHHGGNWTWDHGEYLDREDPGTAAILAIPPNLGRIVGPSYGTSFSAPSVAHEFARIAERYPDAGSNLLRALCALSARPPGGSIAGIPGMRWHGYGRPDADYVLDSNDNRVFLTSESEIDADTTVLYRLPIPPEFAEGVHKRTFRVSLAFDPPVRRERREYIAGSMSVEFVRGISVAEIESIYRRQPTRAEAAAGGGVRMDLPSGENRPLLNPGQQVLSSTTLLRRDFIDGPWDPDHGDYFLVITHSRSPWTERQKQSYANQSYAVAIEIADESRNDLNLYALMRARLAARIRARR